MPKIILMRGLPGSGKSTTARRILAADGNAVRVNRDAIREMLSFREGGSGLEGLVSEIERRSAEAALEGGQNVIVDDTNLSPRAMEFWKGYARENDYKLETVDLTNVPLLTCIENDSRREGKDRVGQGVIERMSLRYLGNLKDEEIVVSDVDGTLADCSHRTHFVKGEKKDWDSFFDPHLVYEDKPRQEIIDKFNSHPGIPVVVTARPEKLRSVTESWLRKHGVRFVWLIMREDGDRRPDRETKRMMWVHILSQSKVLKIFDDRPAVIGMWRSYGANVEDVGDGIEF